MKALVVVADPADQRTIEETFARRDHSIHICSTADEALQIVASDWTPYVFVDLDAEADAVAVIRAVRAHHGGRTWVLTLTSRELPSALRPALEAGADDYLPRPVQGSTLQLKLAIGERALSKRRRRSTLNDSLDLAERRFRTLVETMHEGLFQVDAGGRIASANSRLSQLTGYTLDELLGQRADDLLVDEELLSRLPGQTLLGGGVGSEEYSIPLQTKAGAERWVKLVGAPLPGDDGGSFGVVQDISEQRAAEEGLRQREEYFRGLLESSSDLISIADLETRVLYQSRSAERILGVEPEAMVGTSLLDRMHDDDRERFAAAMERALQAPGSTESVQTRFRHESGEWRMLDSLLKNLVDNPVLGGVLITSRDVTERRKVEAALKRERAFFRLLFENSPAGIVILDAQHRVVEANASFVDLFQHEVASLADRPLNEIIVPEEAREEAEELERLVGSGQSVARETTRLRRDGSSVDVSILAFPIELGGRRIGVYGIFTDITERKNAERQLFHDAFHDALTGLPNRSLLLERLERDLRRAKRREDYAFAVLFLDLDGFKEINDTHGHGAGDAFLIEVARRLEACLRPGDTVARLGGDEFMVILEDIKEVSGATEVGDRILASLATPFALEAQEVQSSGSIGIAFSSTGYTSVDALIGDADLAMYRAKERGKACYEIFDAAMAETATARRDLEDGLRDAFAEHRLELHYQPILSLRDGSLTGFEALARWRHPDRGLLDAAEWIPATGDAGMLAELDAWTLEHAAARLADWTARFGDRDNLSLSVNLSVAEVLRDGLVERLEALRRQYEFHPSSLVLEMSERDLMCLGAEIEKPLWRLHRFGIRLWLDDFGTGASPLGLLHRLPFDALKVDRSFVDEIAPGDESIEVLRAARSLGEALGLTVIAEGVESPDQLRQLRRLGLHRAQGYHLGQPLNAEEAEKRLLRTPDGSSNETTTF
ncbi:MAG: EAL domain-containing protein [Acidobacteriota bacterium]